MQNISVKGPIRLDSFIKWAGVSSTGGQAKHIIQSGMVSVNGEKTISRGKMLFDGDRVDVDNFGAFTVTFGLGEK